MKSSIISTVMVMAMSANANVTTDEHPGFAELPEIKIEPDIGVNEDAIMGYEIAPYSQAFPDDMSGSGFSIKIQREPKPNVEWEFKQKPKFAWVINSRPNLVAFKIEEKNQRHVTVYWGSAVHSVERGDLEGRVLYIVEKDFQLDKFEAKTPQKSIFYRAW